MAFISLLFGIIAAFIAFLIFGLNPIGMFVALVAYILVSSLFYKILRADDYAANQLRD